MRTINAKNGQGTPLTLMIDKGEGDGIIEAGSIQITHSTLSYCDDLVGSSSLEFTLIAEVDGQYRDLYTTDVQGVPVKLMRGTDVIYSGYLDSELYEEEFNADYNYPINFKCGNVKILSRIDYDKSGQISVGEILTYIYSKIGLRVVYNSSLSSGATKSDKFMIDNSIFNKNEEVMDCYEVLEHIHKSLSLRSIVMGDKVYIFDHVYIRSLPSVDYDNITHGNANLSACECYKDVVWSFDTGSKKDIFNSKIDKFEFPYPADSEVIVREKQGYEDPDTGFVQRVTNTKQFENITLLNSRVNVCRNSPRFSGSDQIYIKNNSIARENTAVSIWKSKQMPITTLQSDDWFLNIRLDLLLSIRSNPFRGVNEKEDCQPRTSWFSNHENDFRNHTNYTFIYADVYLYDNQGNITHHLKNTNSSREATPAQWIAGRPTSNGNFIFSFYGNMKNEHGFDSGWQTNSPTVPALGVGYSYGSLTKTMKNKGTLAKLPPVSGSLEVIIYDGVKCIDGADGGTIKQVYSDFKHLWYKDLKVSICDANGHDNYSESEYEYRATLDNNAADTLSVKTVIGQIVDEDYSCRGGLKYGGKFLTSFNLDDINDRLEIVNLNLINKTLTGQRNRIEFDCSDYEPINNKVIVSHLNKSFYLAGFTYNPEHNTYRVTLDEVV